MCYTIAHRIGSATREPGRASRRGPQWFEVSCGVTIPPMPAKCHHSAICVRDFDASMRFYRDGLGLALMWEKVFDGDWPTLFGAPQPKLHSAFLGDPEAPDAGIVELVEFIGGMEPGTTQGEQPQLGFFLLSFYVDVDETLARLAEMGLGGEPRRIEVAGMDDQMVPMATVRDPDGIIVELIGA